MFNMNVRIHPRMVFCLLGIVTVLALPACVTKETVMDSRGNTLDEKYIIHRPVKKFVESVEVE